MIKNIYKKLAPCLLVGAVLIVWVIFVIKVNVETENTVYKCYKVGDEVEYKGYTLKVNGYEKFTEEELEKKYNITNVDMMYDDSYLDIFAYILWMEFTKTEEGDGTIGGSVLQWNNLVSTATATMNEAIQINEYGEKDTESIYNEMEVGETKKFGILYKFTENNLAPKYIENFDNYPLYLELLDYEGHRYITKIELN